MVIEAIPGAEFVIQCVTLVTVGATAVYFRRRERDPEIDVGREVANVSGFALLGATLIQLVLWVR